MKRLKTVLRETWGQSLVPALVAITVGTLLVVPILHYYRSSQVETLAVETTLHRQYAADAAADYAIWRLVNDPAWRSTVDGARSSGVTVTLTEPVNGIQPTVAGAAVAARPDPRAVGQQRNVLLHHGLDRRPQPPDGDVHSNRGIRIKGSDTVIEGIVEYVTDIDVGDVTYIPPPPDNPCAPKCLRCRRCSTSTTITTPPRWARPLTWRPTPASIIASTATGRSTTAATCSTGCTYHR